ncbi:DUF3500 domain-containing protein [Lentzea sp. NPDC034063]|uniref:DUF3500 domain-containing protein n=1 Tax=unclassified Lentzea TaxID=2643253 RepID=UPI0033FF3B9B
MVIRNRADVSVAGHALAFAATLSGRQRSELVRDYSVADARRWSNYPEAVLAPNGRVGLSTATLSERQWAALHALLAVAMGAGEDQGHDEVRQHLAADDHLLALGGRHGYGRGNFRVAYLGEPSDSGRWRLQFGGHHLAISLTYGDGLLVGATPAFRGIEPFTPFVHDGVVCQPGRRKHAALAAVLSSLRESHVVTARVSGRHPDIVMGPGRDRRFPRSAAGIAGAALDSWQRTLLLEAIAAFVRDVDEASADRILSRYTDELDATCLAFGGSVALGSAGDYVRIDGPSVWIEYSLHDGIVCAGPHPHSVWRDKRTDYGGVPA